MRRIYPQKGFNPTNEDYQRLAAAFLPFGLIAGVEREKVKSGYRKCVSVYESVEFGVEKAAPELEPPRAAKENNL